MKLYHGTGHVSAKNIIKSGLKKNSYLTSFLDWAVIEGAILHGCHGRKQIPSVIVYDIPKSYYKLDVAEYRPIKTIPSKYIVGIIMPPSIIGELETEDAERAVRRLKLISVQEFIRKY